MVAMPVGRLVAAALAVGVAIAPAHAAPWKPRKKAARDMLNAAADADQAGNFDRAAALALQSLTVEPSIFAYWSAGQAFMDAGDFARALEQYDQALDDADLPRKERPRIEARRALARAFLDGTAAADAQRWDDARAVYVTILDRHDLYTMDRQHAGAALEQLALRRAAAEAAAKPPPPPAGDSTARTTTARATTPAPTSSTPPPAPIDVRTPARQSRWSDTSALAILGTGAIGVGAGFWLRSHAQDLDDQGDAPDTPEPRGQYHDRANRFRTGATVALAAGGAFVVVGLIKLAIPPDAPRPTLATLHPTTGGAVVVLGGRF